MNLFNNAKGRYSVSLYSQSKLGYDKLDRFTGGVVGKKILLASLLLWELFQKIGEQNQPHIPSNPKTIRSVSIDYDDLAPSDQETDDDPRPLRKKRKHDDDVTSS
jgi:hypothetical protein